MYAIGNVSAVVHPLAACLSITLNHFRLPPGITFPFLSSPDLFVRVNILHVEEEQRCYTGKLVGLNE